MPHDKQLSRPLGHLKCLRCTAVQSWYRFSNANASSYNSLTFNTKRLQLTNLLKQSHLTRLLYFPLQAHPVPFIERDVVPGKAKMPTADAPFGKLAGGICFDFDFPDFIRQAGWKNASILLQPSWTWGPMGQRHFVVNALRAVENGATLFRQVLASQCGGQCLLACIIFIF